MNGTVTKVCERQNGVLSMVFPSNSKSNNIRDLVFKYGYDLVKCKNKINTDHLISFYVDPFVRVYRDIFLARDKNTGSWVLFRLDTD